MRRMTGTITLSAALIALSGAAIAGNEGAYTIMPVQTQTIGANYVAPTPSYLPQPTEVITQPAAMETETMSGGGEVGQIIYNSEPYMPNDAGTTEVITYGSGDTSSYTTNSAGEIIFQDSGTYATTPSN